MFRLHIFNSSLLLCCFLKKYQQNVDKTKTLCYNDVVVLVLLLIVLYINNCKKSTTTIIKKRGDTMKKANTDIREAMRAKKVPVYAVANIMKIHENTLFRRLRYELPEQEKQKILCIIDEIAEKEVIS